MSSLIPKHISHNALRANLRAHACRVGVFRGTIGTRDQVLPSQDAVGRKRTYDMQTRDAPAASRGGEGITPLAWLTVTELAMHVGLVAFDVIVLDCEGCMPDALSDEALTQPTLSLLIFEADFNRHRPFSYGVWHVKLLLWFPSRVARAGCILRRCGADSHGIPARCSAHSHLRRLCGREAPLALPAARDARVRPGFNLSILECGSRLTCLAAEVVTGSREEWEVKRACWVVYRIEMESVPRAHGVLTFYNFLHINMARLMAGHLRGTRITRHADAGSFTKLH